MINHRPIARYVFAEMQEEDIRGLPSEPVFKLVQEFHRAGKDWIYAEFRPRIEASLAAALDQALLKEEQAPTVEQALDCLYTLREMQLAREEKAVCAKIKACERSGDKDRLTSLNLRRHEISNERIALRTRKPTE